MEASDSAARREAADRRRPVDDGTSLLGAFAALLAVALLLHVLWWHGLPVASPWFAVVLAALWTLARPASVGRLALLLAAAGVAILAELPALGTHLLLVLAVAGCVLAHVGGAAARGRPVGAGELFRRLAPFLRAATVVLYAAAVLSKLNDAYLDPATSPAVALSAKVVWFAPSLLDGAWHARPAVWGSLVVELSLPVLLLVRRTRRAGLVLGLVFHAGLALSGTVPFTAIVLALYVGFLPADAPARVRALVRRAPRRVVAGGAALARHRGLVAAGAAVAWIVVAAAVVVAPGLVTGSVLASVTRVVAAGAALAAAAVVVTAWRPGRVAGRSVADPCPAAGEAAPRAGRPTRPPAHPQRRGGVRGVYVLGIVALVAVAASPYLGRRAGDAFTMYSGLRTAPATWNHVLLPRGVRVLDR